MHSALTMVSKQDTTALFWIGISWVSAVMVDKSDLNMFLDLKRAVGFIDKVALFNERFGNGSVHDFYISYYGNLPKAMGRSEEKARYHFDKSVELSEGKSVSPFVSLAGSVCIKNQNVTEFKELCMKALAIDVTQRTENRLANVLGQKKARWFLDHTEDYFLIEEEIDETENGLAKTAGKSYNLRYRKLVEKHLKEFRKNNTDN